MIAACKNVSACKHACLTPPPTFSGFLSFLQSSITLYDEIHRKSSTGVFYTDLQFHRNDPQGITPRENSQGRSNTRYHNNNCCPSKSKCPSRHRSPSSSKSCIVCNKEGCWSNKHSKAVREEAFQHLQNKKNKYNKRYTQIFTKCDQPESANPVSIHLSQLMSDLDLPDSEEFNKAYFTRFGPINGKKYPTELNNEASLYALTRSTSNFKPRNPIICYSDCEFFGIMIDTGAATKSTVGHGQFLAFQKITNIQLDTTTAGAAKIQFGIGNTTSIGFVVICPPFGLVEFHVLNADTPFLLSIADMDLHGVYLNNINNVLVSSTRRFPVTCRFGHLFLL
ncbi:Bgt-20191 [Blumeria graminis f. sp. tritici]|uniref:Bgt-20191 n=1 Tax=Blumeria graminis f. sp. tritici TaxID=62690 RepID=A0A9X9QEB8_BLUGR|nr:Bgt-20191 [Blumeria graminis f. sp. tritici]